MTIIFLSRYQNKIERGVENYVSELSRRLTTRHHVEVHTSCWQLFNRKRSDPVRSDLPGSDLTIIYPLNGYWQTLGCRIYTWLTGSKLVVGGHAGIGRDDRWNLYMFPDLFIAFSQKGYEWAKRVNPFVNIFKIPHGVDLEQFNPRIKPAWLDLERPVFITVSHLLPYKRVGNIAQAVAKLKRGSLLILGHGPLEKEIDELGNTLLGPTRYLRLQVPHRDVPSYLVASNIFTLTSDSQEAFGLVYLEALACNLPIVAMDDSLRHELIGDGGLFVKNAENSEEYALVLDRATKTDWGNKPRRQAEKFSWDKIAQEYCALFEKFIK